MNRIVRKLRARTGASITFALLLFLVCSVLASVALTAATASAGRMSEIAASDQRYFAVSSAAELMKDLIESETETIVTKKIVKDRYTIGADGIISDSSSAEEQKSFIVEKTPAAIVKSYDLISQQEIVPTFAPKDIPMDAAINLFQKGTDKERAFSLTVTGEDSLSVTIEETLYSDGTIELTLYNTSGDPLKQMLTFSVKVTPGALPSDSPEVSSSGNVITNITTTYETMTYQWTLLDIKTVGA